MSADAATEATEAAAAAAIVSANGQSAVIFWAAFRADADVRAFGMCSMRFTPPSQNFVRLLVIGRGSQLEE
ncbi:hypothetical protein GTC3P0254_07430 [Burkholderia pseudomallei]|uniref:hypothetical protein n=1 Tax=Burkholderia mallei TaxID=13373 RepID=UPI0002EB9A6D|nr:hypothetical protein GTC050_54560 [Burkholderia pseudomallei]BEH52219.1 hypothetical protein TKS_54510 [Burkholderia pseudomallei]BEH58138.1 hypothetical protein BpKM376_53170 [Burkholderia pseudomallei]BEH70291.1 hypothetical protein BpKM391_53660 [Burkholderia pseudomallei]GEA53766.1 hypothetical protein GTC3P0254_07430 [Burkholderia pseudomallei]